MAGLGNLAVKAGKAVVNFIVKKITEYIQSEEFKKQMMLLIGSLVNKMVKQVLEEKNKEKLK